MVVRLHRVGQRCVGVVEAAGRLERKREVVQHRHARAIPLDGALEVLDRVAPARLAQRDQAEMKRGDAVHGPQLPDATKLAFRLSQHARAVEGDAEIAMLVDARGILARRGRRRGGNPAEPTGREQAVEHAAHLELAQSSAVHDLADGVKSVDQWQHPAFGLDEMRIVVGGASWLPFEGVDRIDRRDLLGDHAPFVDPPRALQQQPLRIQAQVRVWRIGRRRNLEGERAARPGEQRVHRLFDLATQLVGQLASRDESEVDQDLADAAARHRHLRRDRFLELFDRDFPCRHQPLTESIGTGHHAGERDPPFVEPDRTEVAITGDRQAARSASQEQQLHHVGQRCFLE